jgi:hypothetical protein
MVKAVEMSTVTRPVLHGTTIQQPERNEIMDTLVEIPTPVPHPSAEHPCHEFGIDCYCRECDETRIALEIAGW